MSQICLYPTVVRDAGVCEHEGFGYDIEQVCNEIHDATEGWGANKKKVIDALATRDATDRYKISIRYKELYEKSLLDVMKKEFSGDLGMTLEFLSLPLDEAECRMLKKATDGIGCASNVIYSICCGRTNEEIERLKKTHFKLYSKDLIKLLGKELTGDHERLIINCLQGGEEVYDPQYHTKELANEEAEEIYKKGQGKWFGTDERAIFKLICKAPAQHVEAVNHAYAEKYGYSLLKAMEKSLGGNAKKAMLFTIGMKLKPYEAMANLIKEACAGMGTDEILLTCCIIRYQDVMRDVMTAHIELFGKTIHDRVRSECRGKYKDALITILNTSWSEEG
mmetsp:Transcript_582/g.879  ORF Transcript_582/g.879 Transcript_582/m.879 type:complete len:336 (+) Transcript_582:98-1105(+)